MKRKLPFEDALENKLQHLPKPGEEDSWQAMSRLLDKKDDRKLPPPIKKYFIFLLLALLLLSGLWALLRNNNATKEITPGKNNNDAALVSKNSKVVPGKMKNVNNKSNNTIDVNQPTLAVTDSLSTKAKAGMIAQPEARKHEQGNENKIDVGTRPGGTKNNPGSGRVVKTVSGNNNQHTQKTTTGKPLDPSTEFTGINSNGKKITVAKRKQSIHIRGSIPGENISSDVNPGNKKDSFTQVTFVNNKKKLHTRGKMNLKVAGNAEEDKKEENVVITLPASTATKHVAGYDTVAKSMNDDIAKDPVATILKPVITATASKDSADSSTKKNTPLVKSEPKQKKSKRLTWSAGVGLQQQIPAGSQKFSSYGFNGNKNIIDDYIPYVYLRLEKPGKWFTQVEFSYASPRMISEFPYSRKTTVDNFSKQVSVISMSLKKMYYHKIPLSFNYYIKPRWSVGAGVVYSKLYRIISEQQLTVKNIQTQEEETNSKIIPAGYTDSFFYKSEYSWMLQSNYEWRRFGFGIRYSMDMQPYMKYTKPSGEIDDRRNWSLEFLLRYRIWKSR